MWQLPLCCLWYAGSSTGRQDTPRVALVICVWPRKPKKPASMHPSGHPSTCPNEGWLGRAGELARLRAAVAALARGGGVGLPIMEAAAEAEAELAALAGRSAA